MTAAQTRILEMFRALTVGEREALLPRLAASIESDGAFDGLSADEIAAIEEGLAQAERGEVEEGAEVLDRIAARYQFPRA